MDRRDFLKQIVLAGVGLSACSMNAPSVQPGPPERARAPKKVLVIGAGLSGLVAGHELIQAGHEVIVLEARGRPGGRVQTLREPFSDGLYTEAGAFFIPDIHDLTLRYARLFGLPLEPVAPRGTGRLYHVRGKQIREVRGANVTWPVDLTAEEQRLGLPGMWQKYVTAALKELGDVAAPGWPGGPLLEKYDRLSFAEYLRAQGASPGAVALLALDPYFDQLGDGVDSYSALPMLRDLVRGQAEKKTYTIQGGNDQLPKAFAAKLAREIRYGAPVVQIEPGERSVGVVFLAHGEHQRLEADRVIAAVPFSVLRRIAVSPPFSAQKRAAIEQLPYTSISRVFLQYRRKVWTDEGLPSSATTDLPLRWVWEPTVNQPGSRGILWSETAGPFARRLAAMREDERIGSTVEEMEKVYPGSRDQFEVGASKAWDDEEWTRGAYSWFKPGEVASLQPHIARPEGRVHFAGEHASTWTGWMQGALESGLRAAREVHEAA